MQIESTTRIRIKLTDDISIVVSGNTKEEAATKIFTTLVSYTGTFNPHTDELEMANTNKFSWNDFPDGLSLEAIKLNEKNGVKQKYATPYRMYEVEVFVDENVLDQLIAQGVKDGKTWCPNSMCPEK